MRNNATYLISRRPGLTGLRSAKGRRGFSILELLIAVIIIGILAAILIPIIANRSQKARVAAAESDLERIGTALEQVGVDTGYYPRLLLIDDTGGAINGFAYFSGAGGDIYNNINSYPSPTTYYDDVQDRLFINIAGSEIGEFVPLGTNQRLLESLQENETAFNWNGPYISFQKDSSRTPTGGPSSPDDALPDGLPDDPWGNNYLLFTREGYVEEPEGQIRTSPVSINSQIADPQIFDRTTVLSLGPDGVPGSSGNFNFGQGDDIVRPIGP